MGKSCYLTIRIDPEVKADAGKLFNKLGITTTDAVTMFLHKALITGGLPFSVNDSASDHLDHTSNNKHL